jgi:hypothetical protein
MATNIIQPTITSTSLSPGNASMLAVATMGLSGNKYVLGLMILLINLGARYIGNEVSDFMHKVLNHKFARRFLIFLVLWMGTRDLVVAGVITISFILLVNTLFNENSDYCILPVTNNSSITKEEYLLAKQVVSKYEVANPQQNLPPNMTMTMNNTTNNNNSVNSTSLPINNNSIK